MDDVAGFLGFGKTRLFVGAYISAGIRLKEVCAAINCAAEVQNVTLALGETLRLEWHEVKGEKLVDVKEQVLSFVRDHSNGSVFVYCAAGKSRSVSVALMILFYLEGIPLRESFQALFRARPCIEPNSDLWEQLCEMTNERGLTQDELKLDKLLVQLREENRLPCARNADELAALFRTLTEPRKSFRIAFSGFVDDKIVELMLHAPKSVTQVRFVDCAWKDEACHRAIRKKLHFEIVVKK